MSKTSTLNENYILSQYGKIKTLDFQGFRECCYTVITKPQVHNHRYTPTPGFAQKTRFFPEHMGNYFL